MKAFRESNAAGTALAQAKECLSRCQSEIKRLETDRDTLLARLGGIDAKKRARDETDDLCSICLDKPRTMALVPCGHKCLCSGCASKWDKQKCPMCRKLVTSTMRIYE